MPGPRNNFFSATFVMSLFVSLSNRLKKCDDEGATEFSTSLHNMKEQPSLVQVCITLVCVTKLTGVASELDVSLHKYGRERSLKGVKPLYLSGDKCLLGLNLHQMPSM